MPRMKQTSQKAKGAPQKSNRVEKIGKSGPAKGGIKPKSGAGDADQKKKRHWKPGTVSLREIKKQQRSFKPLIRQLPFRRLARNIAAPFKNDLKWTADALNVLQDEVEAYATDRFSKAQRLVCGVKKIVVFPKHLQMIKEIQDMKVDVMDQDDSFIAARKAQKART